MNQTIKIIFVRCLCFAGAVIVVGFVYNWLSPGGLPLIAGHQSVIVQGKTQDIPLFINRKETAQKNSPVSLHPVEEIDTEHARQFFASGNVIFLDARDYEEYLAGHITGAVSVPFTEFQNDPEIIAGLDRSARIVTYCDGTECQTSIDLAVRLNEMGFTDVWFYFGGWNEWKTAGLPVMKGSRP